MPTVTFKKYSVITSNTAILQKHGNLTEKKKTGIKENIPLTYGLIILVPE